MLLNLLFQTATIGPGSTTPKTDNDGVDDPEQIQEAVDEAAAEKENEIAPKTAADIWTGECVRNKMNDSFLGTIA